MDEGSDRERRAPRRGAADDATAPGGGDGASPSLKAIAVLETLARSERPLSLSELSALLAIPKPTLHRIVRLLERARFVEREPGGRRYVGGGRLLGLALDIFGGSTRAAPRRAIIEALASEVGETCNLGVMVANHVVYVDRVETIWPFGLRFEPGSRVPLHCTAIGKLLLAHQPEGRREQLIAGAALQRYTPNTLTDPDALRRDLDRIRETGVSVDDQEFLAGVVCVAAPVADADGRVIAGVAVSAPVARLSRAAAEALYPRIAAAAASLGRIIAEAR